MKIHYEIFNNLCINRNMKGFVESDFCLYNNDKSKDLTKEEHDVIMKHWLDFETNKNDYDYEERYKKPLLHYKNTKTIKVKILAHKRKYLYCEVLGEHRKRTNFLRILKTRKTGHLIEDKVYSLDLFEIQSGALHESNIYELAYKLQIT